MEIIAQMDAYFEGQPLSRQLFTTLHELVRTAGQAELRVSKSQIAFRRKKIFASAWMPAMYLKRRTAPLVMSVFLRSRDPSPRWKQVVEPYPGRFTHHLELYAITDLDEQVRGWLQLAWELAG